MATTPHDLAFFHGTCQPMNPGGTGGWVFVVHDSNGSILSQRSGLIRAAPDMSAQFAEYTAANRVVERWLELQRPGELIISGTSELVAKQMSDAWKIRRGYYRPLALKLRRTLAGTTKHITWRLVSSAANRIAEDICRQRLEDAGVRIRH